MLRRSALLLTLALAACSSPSGGDDSDDADVRVVTDAARDTTRDVPEADTAPDASADGANDATDSGADDDADADDAPDGRDDRDVDAAADGSGAADAAEDAEPDAPDTGELPRITDVFPTVTLSDAFIYVSGELLGEESGDTTGMSATVSIFTAEGETRVPLEIVSAVERSMILRTPQDFAEQVGGSLGLLEVVVPRGTARWLPLYGTDDTTFSGKTRLGEGLRGNVYRLVEGAMRLPNLDDPCNDELVLAGDGIACPFTSVVADDLQIDPVDWEVGFPGLSFDLREWFAIRFSGEIEIPEAGIWTFRTCSDDGSRLWLENMGSWTRILDNDGQHAFICADGAVQVGAGRRGIRVDFFQGPRTRLGLSLQWRGPNDDDFTEVPETALRLFPVDP